MMTWRFMLLAGILTAQFPLFSEEKLPETVQFNRDIRPILSNKCFTCHGPDEKRRKGKLRLDVEAEAKADVIVAGKLADSEFWARITSTDADQLMPPAKAKKPLTPKEVALFKRWIEQGAKYEGHWAFISPKTPTPPKGNLKWGHNPIDHFVLKQLEANGLKPTTEASRELLIRRVTFDLTGLPPTLAEVDAFVNDKSPNAYEKVVDRLLASKSYAERMTLHWMDVARYGDSSVHHADGPRTMWPWRDWVINAYHTNKSFKEFATEQLAGDLMPNATVNQKIATGFNRNHGTTDEGGLIVEEYRVEYVVDRVKTTGNVFLGLSIECAQCHSHKYDPISHKEYYEFFAFFNNNADSGKQTRGGNAPPMVDVISKENQAKRQAAEAKLKTTNDKIAAHRKGAQAAFEKWTAKAAKNVDAQPKEPAGLLAHFPLDAFQDRKSTDLVNEKNEVKWEGGGRTVAGQTGQAFRVEGNGFINVKGVQPPEWNQPFSFGCWVKPDAGNANGALFSKMDEGNAYRGFDLWLQQGSVGTHLVSKWQDNAIKVVSKAKVPPKKWTHVFVTYDGKGKAAGTKIYINGKVQEHNIEADGLNDTIQTPKTFRIGRRFNTSQANNIEIDEVRLYGRELIAADINAVSGSDPIAPLLAITPDKRTPKQTEALLNHYLNNIDQAHQKLAAEKRTAEAEIAAVNKNKVNTMIMGDRGDMRKTYVLDRGHYEHPLKEEEIKPGVPAFLPPMPEGAPANRLGLAQWLTRPDHPLTARVAVNRYWSLLFGQGIVKSVSDFGTQGAWPTHPALLDWLATDFVKNDWNIKHTFKQIVMSATYRQSSKLNRELYNRDPENNLIARGPRFRLQGEFVRDNALAVSGLLVDQAGGPGVKPYQPPGLWNEVSLGGNVRFRQDTGENLYRKSMYTYWKRSAPAPSMTIFDAPTREKCMVERPRTNTPLQALVTLNDPQFTEAARNLAQRMIKEGGQTAQERVTYGYRLVAARQPKPIVANILIAAYNEELENFKKNTEAADKLLNVGESKRDETINNAEHAAWTIVASMLLNLDEVITRL